MSTDIVAGNYTEQEFTQIAGRLSQADLGYYLTVLV